MSKSRMRSSQMATLDAVDGFLKWTRFSENIIVFLLQLPLSYPLNILQLTSTFYWFDIHLKIRNRWQFPSSLEVEQYQQRDHVTTEVRCPFTTF